MCCYYFELAQSLCAAAFSHPSHAVALGKIVKNNVKY